MEQWLRELEYGTMFRLTWLGPGLFRISNCGVHMDLLVGEKAALLWDTGYGFDDLHGLIRRITDLPLYVINSHAHLDHTCGNWQFPSVMIHPADLETCKTHNTPHVRTLCLKKTDLPDWFDREAYLNRGHGQLCPVTEGRVFDLGGKTVEVIELPGHTPGSIGLHYREERALYTGDAVNDFMWLYLPEATSVAVYRQTLQKVLDLDFDWMIQSHHHRILPKDRVYWYVDLIDHLDYAHGEQVPPPVGPYRPTRICIRGGLTLENRYQPDFAAILLSDDKL